jgi:hypothetical protein
MSFFARLTDVLIHTLEAKERNVSFLENCYNGWMNFIPVPYKVIDNLYETFRSGK